MRITAKVDYAVRACIELARNHPDDGSRPVPVTRQRLAEERAIPAKFLEHILSDLRRGGLVASVRGTDGGYWLARPPAAVSVADIIRAVEGPLADVRGDRPEELDYGQGLASLQRLWIALRATIRSVLETTTLADLVAGRLPADVEALAELPDAWQRR